MTTLENIAKEIQLAGGTAFFVGGCVRDEFFNRESKDIDIEVFGITSEKLLEVLKQFGKVDEVGVSFGVIKLTVGDLDFDFSLPRREVKTGVGHTGFKVVPDPTMTPRQAALRRDFTMNALMRNMHTGELLDFFGGLQDIQKRILRHTSDKFAEDPLRVLRGMQFAARFGMTMAEETIELCKTLKREFHTISKERLFVEFHKLFTKGVKPSLGLDILIKTGWAKLFNFDEMFLEDSFECLDTFCTLTPFSEHKFEVLLAVLIESGSNGIDFLDLIDVPNKTKNIVSELFAMEASKLALIEETGWLPTQSILPIVRTAIGLNLKHTSKEIVADFHQGMLMIQLAKEISEFSDEDLKPKINGGDLISKGWSPKAHKQLFGQELKRLHKLQLMNEFSREQLLLKIKNQK